MKNKLYSVLIGIVFIAMGIGFAGEIFHWWDFNPFFDGWWTLFIIIPSIVTLCTSKAKTGAIIGLAVGIVLLLGARGLMDFKILISALLVVLGIRFIIKALLNQESKTPPDYDKKEDSNL
jgi:hypothetical protein